MANAVSSDTNRDDLQSIQSQIHKRKADALESIRRIHGIIDESEALGTSTAAVSSKGTFISSITDLKSLG
jgi:hypothetical protein